MAKLCMKYEDNFISSLKRMGFVSKIFSQTKVRRLRELNSALAKRTGCKITVKNLDDKFFTVILYASKYRDDKE